MHFISLYIYIIYYNIIIMFFAPRDFNDRTRLQNEWLDVRWFNRIRLRIRFCVTCVPYRKKKVIPSSKTIIIYSMYLYYLRVHSYIIQNSVLKRFFFSYNFYFILYLLLLLTFYHRIFTHYVVQLQHNRRIMYAVRIVTIDALELHGSPRIYNKSNGVRTRHTNDTCHVRCVWKHGNYYDMLYKILQYILWAKMWFRYRHTSTALVTRINI